MFWQSVLLLILCPDAPGRATRVEQTDYFWFLLVPFSAAECAATTNRFERHSFHRSVTPVRPVGSDGFHCRSPVVRERFFTATSYKGLHCLSTPKQMKRVVTNKIVRRPACGTDVESRQSSSEAISCIRNPQFTHKHVLATLKISTFITRTGKKKPTCELIDLKPLQAATTDTKEEK